MVEVREMAPADLPAVAEIWNPVIRDTAATFTTVEKTPRALAAWLAHAGPRLIAAQSGVVVGFASADPFRPGPGYAFTWEHTIHVAPDARGRGIGRALMAALTADLRRRGARSMIAGVSGENAAATAFHTRLGFTEAGCLRDAGRKFGRWLDLSLMQRLL